MSKFKLKEYGDYTLEIRLEPGYHREHVIDCPGSISASAKGCNCPAKQPVDTQALHLYCLCPFHGEWCVDLEPLTNPNESWEVH